MVQACIRDFLLKRSTQGTHLVSPEASPRSVAEEDDQRDKQDPSHSHNSTTSAVEVSDLDCQSHIAVDDSDNTRAKQRDIATGMRGGGNPDLLYALLSKLDTLLESLTHTNGKQKADEEATDQRSLSKRQTLDTDESPSEEEEDKCGADLDRDLENLYKDSDEEE